MGVNMMGSVLYLGRAAYWCMFGAVVSASVVNKLSHIVEYVLNKKFGDYTNLRTTVLRPDNLVLIVSMGPKKDHYYIQNVVLAVLVGLISSQAIRILALAGLPNNITTPLLIGSIAAPILFGLFNSVLRNIKFNNWQEGRWVVITDKEAIERGVDPTSIPSRIECVGQIDPHSIPTYECNVRVYRNFGSEPSPWH